MFKLTDEQGAAFRLKIEQRSEPIPECGCWIWMGSTNGGGYGHLSCAGIHGAHRIAFAAFCGPIEPGLHVCHRCDVPECVNPHHLFLGTRLDNMADKVRKGRARGQHPILNEPKVIEIRRQFNNGVSQPEIAARFGVSRSTIGAVIAKNNWWWVPDEPGFVEVLTRRQLGWRKRADYKGNRQ